jgi:hypothetical protein
MAEKMSILDGAGVSLPYPLDGWQPIETAPKKGWMLLGRADGDFPLVGRAYYPGRFLGVDESEIWPIPTHWMPLPEPPVTEAPEAA